MPEAFPAAAPATLDRAGIALRIPHQGRMCLLDRLLSWSPEHIHCVAVNHREPDHPLRSASGLLSPCAIEYAAQAMALHGALLAPSGAGPRAGYLASARNVRLAVARLDGVAGPLQVRAERLAGEARQVMYRFEVSDEHGRLLVDGRATVVLDTPLARAPAARDQPSPEIEP
ncbi:MAG: hydroxymyristoyl-ACP dehydratase [Methylibium sp.]|nr:hydroxymyristoyl-ACP dehydratase [Methylibium sp.]